MQFTADAIEHSSVSETKGELHFVAPEEFRLAMNEKDILKAVQKIARRPLRIRIAFGTPEASQTARPKPPPDDVSARALSHPEVRRCGPWDDPRPAPAKVTCAIADINMDMVGEDTVKTNGRFYFTRTPDSVPSFLDALLSDVLEQMREANLFAPTGTHNYWPTDVLPYAQGSDHDLFLGLGIPSTMLGHDPDWTHHTSEDTVDKTDASELLRVGTLASAAVEWMTSADPETWKAINDRGTAEFVRSTVTRANRLFEFGANQLATATLRQRTREYEKLGTAPPMGPLDFAGLVSQGASGVGPRRLTLLPISPIALDDLSGDDKKWWDEQDAKYAHLVDSLATKPTFELLVYETVNFMDGHRSTADIAQLLSAEYLMPFDQAWVDRCRGSGPRVRWLRPPPGPRTACSCASP